jgi:hypothetical protein
MGNAHSTPVVFHGIAIEIAMGMGMGPRPCPFPSIPLPETSHPSPSLSRPTRYLMQRWPKLTGATFSTCRLLLNSPGTSYLAVCSPAHMLFCLFFLPPSTPLQAVPTKQVHRKWEIERHCHPGPGHYHAQIVLAGTSFGPGDLPLSRLLGNEILYYLRTTSSIPCWHKGVLLLFFLVCANQTGLAG